MPECPICQTPKPDSDFPLRNGIRRYSYCKACFCRKYNDPYYAANKKKYRDAAATRKIKYKQMMFGLLTQCKCVDCGESDPLVLEFDHVRGNKDGNISAMVEATISWPRILEEIAKCDVRCANCHRRQTAIRGNWYRHKLNNGVRLGANRASNTRNESSILSTPAFVGEQLRKWREAFRRKSRYDEPNMLAILLDMTLSHAEAAKALGITRKCIVAARRSRGIDRTSYGGGTECWKRRTNNKFIEG